MKSLLCIQDQLSTALSLLEQARLAERTDAFADRTRRWFVSGQGRSRLVGCMLPRGSCTWVSTCTSLGRSPHPQSARGTVC